MHCDIDQVASIEHIPRALEEIGVDRIGHGTNNIEDQRLIEVAKSRGIGFTCCALSNSFVTSDIGADEILQLLRHGDGHRRLRRPGLLRRRHDENYTGLAGYAALSAEDVLHLARNTLDVAWIGAADRSRSSHRTAV